METRTALRPGTFIRPSANLSLLAPWKRYSCHYSLLVNDGPNNVHPNDIRQSAKNYVKSMLEYSGVIPTEQLQLRLGPAIHTPGKRINAYE
eukprot:4897672-Prorocentrum_lima.AAC.1